MDENKKIQLQQKIIDDLEDKNQCLIEENNQLKKEIEDLKDKLSFEEAKPKKGYEKAKELILELEKDKNEYENLIIELKNKKNECKQLFVELKEMKVAYTKQDQ